MVRVRSYSRPLLRTNTVAPGMGLPSASRNTPVTVPEAGSVTSTCAIRSPGPSVPGTSAKRPLSESLADTVKSPGSTPGAA